MKKKHGKMGGASRRLLAVLAVGVLGQAAQPAQAAVAGAWETFFKQANTQSWRVYHNNNGTIRLPLWSDTPVNQEYLYYNYPGASGVGFFVDYLNDTGSFFTGNYAAQKIAGIACRIYIANLDVLNYMDCTIWARSPHGEGYYTQKHPAGEFQTAGWQTMYFDLHQSWAFYNGTDWVALPPTTFTYVEELQINFTPKDGTAGGSRVGIDDVKLEPTMPPALSTSVTTTVPQQFRLAFTPAPGVKCRIEKMKTAPDVGWDTVIGQTDIKGPGEYVFLRPLAPPGEIFRVAAEAVYTMVVTP
jgi:hypothetical protein